MMKIVFVLLFAAATIFGHELKNYSGPCKGIIDYVSKDEATCERELKEGQFVVSAEYIEVLKKEIANSMQTMQEKFPGANITEEMTLERGKLHRCVMEKLKFMNNNGTMDYDEMLNFAENSKVVDAKIRDGLIVFIKSLKEHEKGGKGLKGLLESDVLSMMTEVCEIKKEHWAPAEAQQ